jgi:ribosome maturation factor RimP
VAGKWALGPFFVYWVVAEELVQNVGTLEKLIEPVVTGLGYLYVGLQLYPQGKHSLVRLYVDKPGGVTIDDCTLVSRQVGAVLEVEAPETANYTLEVSSPGLDRLLFKPEQFKEYLGKQVSVHLNVAINGQRNFKGILKDVQDSVISVESDKGLMTFSFTDIHEARLLPKW